MSVIRLRNVQSGAIVSVPDEKVARLGAEWVPADEAEPKRARRPASDRK